jgi:hypothetical protein
MVVKKNVDIIGEEFALTLGNIALHLIEENL